MRQGVLLLDKNVTGMVQQVLDASEDCVTALGENRPSPDFKAALEAIERVLGMEPANRRRGARVSRQSGSSVSAAVSAAGTVRIAAQNFDGLLRSAGGLLTESQRQDQVTEQLNRIARQLTGMEKEAEYVHRSAGASLRPARRWDLNSPA